ncbi:MAG: tetratricopeptide repeat protein [Candidatus Omnitrophota bacterium]
MRCKIFILFLGTVSLTGCVSTMDRYSPELYFDYMAAKEYAQRGDMEKAVETMEFVLTEHLKKYPNDTEALILLGQAYYERKKYDESLAVFVRLCELKPKDGHALYQLGYLYMETGQKDQAVKTIQKSLKYSPNNPDALNTLGYLYIDASVNLAEATEMVQKAIRLRPGNGAYYDSLGWAYYKQGREDLALANLQKADRLYKDPAISDHLGDVYRSMNNPEKAMEYWAKSLELDPDQPAVIQKIEQNGGQWIKGSEIRDAGTKGAVSDLRAVILD